MEGMLEKVTARTGDTVLKRDGRLTASCFDPRREARDWVQSLAPITSGRLAILGVGSGYHLAELGTRFPSIKILALDFHATIIEAALALHGDALQGIEFVPISTEGALLDTERVRRFTRAAFDIVDHPPSQLMEGPRYKEIRARLIAREPIFFADWIRRDERWAKLFPLQAVSDYGAERLLSIKDISRFVDGRGQARPQDAAIIRVLRELVK